MSKLLQRLSDATKSGVYRASRTDEILAATHGSGLHVARIDLGGAAAKEALLARIAGALAFPSWFGGNWDALEDCLSDLSWQPGPGYVLLLEHGKHFGAGHKQEFVTAVEVLDGVAEYWQGQGKPFWAIVSGPEGWDAGLPLLPDA